MRRRRRLPPLPEDDGLIGFRGGPTTEMMVKANSHVLMDGFDDLPEFLRDKINYAETPEEGALPTGQLIGKDGPWRDLLELYDRMVNLEIRRRLTSR